MIDTLGQYSAMQTWDDKVSLYRIDDAIACVVMHDIDGKNSFSASFTDALMSAFEKVENNERFKTLMLTGQGNYFSAGGTYEELISIFEGKINFDEMRFYRFLYDYPLPTLALVQGHAIGGGLAMACFADIAIFSKEAFYSANFMDFGFTPGMGSTEMLIQKFGSILGWEMLMTAKRYQGNALLDRSVPVSILNRDLVFEHGLDLSRSIVSKPLNSLLLLKKHLKDLHSGDIEAVIEKELKMHKKTFKSEEVRQNIQDVFGINL